MHRTVMIHSAAPAKPLPGQPCNGCGVCCAAGPCPVGVLVSRRAGGACSALVWKDSDARYTCGVLDKASSWPGVVGKLAGGWARRTIAAGQGCDCNLEVERAVA
jgi:hypothetical protein